MEERGYRAHPLTSMILTEGPVEMLPVGQLANDCVRVLQTLDLRRRRAMQASSTKIRLGLGAS